MSDLLSHLVPLLEYNQSLDVTSEQKEDRSTTRVLVNITVATYLRQAA